MNGEKIGDAKNSVTRDMDADGSHDSWNRGADLQRIRDIGLDPALCLGLDGAVENIRLARHAV